MNDVVNQEWDQEPILEASSSACDDCPWYAELLDSFGTQERLSDACQLELDLYVTQDLRTTRLVHKCKAIEIVGRQYNSPRRI